jgi:hypothetical protein
MDLAQVVNDPLVGGIPDTLGAFDRRQIERRVEPDRDDDVGGELICRGGERRRVARRYAPVIKEARLQRGRREPADALCVETLQHVTADQPKPGRRLRRRPYVGNEVHLVAKRREPAHHARRMNVVPARAGPLKRVLEEEEPHAPAPFHWRRPAASA